MKGFNLFFLLVINISCCYAQQQFTVSGIIRASKTQTILPYTIITIKHTNQATVSNEHGVFSFSFIKSPNDTVVFSLIGYDKKEIAINTLSANDSLSIELTEKAFDLPVTQIPGLSAKEMVRKAIKNLKQNFPDSNLWLQSFYRQYHKEDDSYVRLIEAIVITNEKRYHDYVNSDKSEKVVVRALRRSDVREENKAQHGDHLMDLINENPFKFPTGSVLNLKGIDYFDFHFTESKTAGETVIEFSSVLSSDVKVQHGLIFIEDETFVIKRLIIETFPNQNSKVRHFAAAGEPYLWKFRNGKYEISFRKINGQVIFDRMVKSYTHYLFDSKVNSLAHIVEENFELQSEKSISTIPKNFRFSLTSNLYSHGYLYDEHDWKYFPPLQQEIKADLEKHSPLIQQFIDNGNTKR